MGNVDCSIASQKWGNLNRYCFADKILAVKKDRLLALEKCTLNSQNLGKSDQYGR